MRPSPWRSPFAKRTYVAGILWSAGLIAGWLTGVSDASGWLRFRTDPAGLLLTAAALVGGANFAGSGLRAARTLRLDMNFLMTAALTGALLIGEPFEAATLAFLFSLAELLERFAVDRGRRSIEKLLELAPEQAELVEGSNTRSVRAADLGIGQVYRVRPGDRLAADGKVVAGSSSINEATITGESVPRTRTVGDPVFAGTFNTDGALDIEVTADAAHSTLARIVQLVGAAEAQRAPVEHAVRRFARIYTPIVVILAVLVITIPPLFWQADAAEWFTRGLTLLVIACPCALVIATPVTVVSALTSAARHGVLIKGGEYLETLGAVKALAVDKTGTLTTGELEVDSYTAIPADRAATLLRGVGILESRSEHPIARALVAYAERSETLGAGGLTEFVAVPGQGVRGRVDGREIRVGTETFAGNTTADSTEVALGGLARVYVRDDQGTAGVFTVRDHLRPNAAEVIGQLHRLGVRPVVLLTGDHGAAASQVATAVGIDDVRARLLPEQKVEAVRELRQRHGSVAMVGDGVNDAPALAQADLGIAMGAAGSPATIETADIALMGDDISRLPYAVNLARRARRTIRFNISLALGLKLLLAVGALTGTVSLAIAVLVGDMGGTIAVTANALRLARSR